MRGNRKQLARHALAAPSAMKQRTADVQAHGSQAPPAAETLHTTDEHPFLTTDRGFVSAEDLRIGEQIRQLDGGERNSGSDGGVCAVWGSASQ